MAQTGGFTYHVNQIWGSIHPLPLSAPHSLVGLVCMVWRGGQGNMSGRGCRCCSGPGEPAGKEACH